MFKNYKPTYKNISKIKEKSKYKGDIKRSKLEIFFEVNIMKVLSVDYSIQKKLASKYYDFYIPEYNILIEVDGDYYHAKNRNEELNDVQKKNILNDHKKNMIAKSKGYKLMRFWESDINNNTLSVLKKLKAELIKRGYPNN